MPIAWRSQLAGSLGPAFAVAGLGSLALAQGATTRVSVGSNGIQANSYSIGPTLSADGRFVGFHSYASNLVATQTTQFPGAFIHDRVAGLTELVSVDSTGTAGNRESFQPAISADGNIVAFDSDSTNLVPGDSNFAWDVFVHDRQSGATERVSVDSNGLQSNDISGGAALSSDGRIVVFLSLASQLVPGDTNGQWDVFVRDRLLASTTRVSVSSSGAEANSGSASLAVSGDGRLVAFASDAVNLVAGDSNGTSDVFVHDRVLGTTERVSVSSAGAEANSWSYLPALSFDGRFVAFSSEANNLVPGDTNGVIDVFVRDRASGTTTRVSVGWNGGESNGGSGCGCGGGLGCHPMGLTISGDARTVAFVSYASNLVPGDTNACADVFAVERATGITTRVSVDSAGSEGNSPSGEHNYVGLGWLGTGVAISDDGSAIAFSSLATNLVALDTNNSDDVFVYYNVPCGGITYCTAGTTSHGCTATLSASGAASASSASAFVIQAHGVEGQKSGLIFYGISGRNAAPWGASVLCVRHPLQRASVQNSGGTIYQCDGSLALDWNGFIATHASALGQPFAAGVYVQAQAWFRDPPSVKGSGLSDALEFRVCP